MARYFVPKKEVNDRRGQQMVKYNPDIHHRRSIRLKGYDYSSPGLYFITICTKDREHLFGEINNDKMVLNHAGLMVQTVWDEIPRYYHHFDIHEFVVMPNHIHGIIEIINTVTTSVTVGADPRVCPDNNTVDLPQSGQTRGSAPTDADNMAGLSYTGRSRLVADAMSLPDIVKRFKTLTTKKYIDGVHKNNWPPFDGKLWQRNYYEHIIRNEKSYYQISEYIQTNPFKWQDDAHYA